RGRGVKMNADRRHYWTKIAAICLCPALASCSSVLEEVGAAPPSTGAKSAEEAHNAASPANVAKAAPASKETPSSAARPIVLLRGSNTIGLSLAPRLVKSFLGRRGATNIAVDDSDRAHERARVTADLEGQHVAVEIDSPGTKAAFEGLAKGECDIGMA